MLHHVIIWRPKALQQQVTAYRAELTSFSKHKAGLAWDGLLCWIPGGCQALSKKKAITDSTVGKSIWLSAISSVPITTAFSVPTRGIKQKCWIQNCLGSGHGACPQTAGVGVRREGATAGGALWGLKHRWSQSFVEEQGWWGSWYFLILKGHCMLSKPLGSVAHWAWCLQPHLAGCCGLGGFSVPDGVCAPGPWSIWERSAAGTDFSSANK